MCMCFVIFYSFYIINTRRKPIKCVVIVTGRKDDRDRLPGPKVQPAPIAVRLRELLDTL